MGVIYIAPKNVKQTHMHMCHVNTTIKDTWKSESLEET